MSPQAQFRAWRNNDIEAILGINAAAQPHVARLDRREIGRLLAMAARLWVIADRGDTAIAYLIAFRGDAPYDGEEFEYFGRRLDRAFLYIDQVAIHPEHRRSGLGRALYDQVERLARTEGSRALCCEVNVVPPNPDSRGFHARAGFVALAQLDVADGRTVELLTRPLDVPAA